MERKCKREVNEELERIELHPSRAVQTQPSEETRLVQRLYDSHHPKDEEDCFPVFIMKQILGSQIEKGDEKGLKRYLPRRYRSPYSCPSRHWMEGQLFDRYAPKKSGGPIHILWLPEAEGDLNSIPS